MIFAPWKMHSRSRSAPLIAVAADVKILPWRTFGTEMQKRIFPDNYVGKIMFKVLFFLEDLLPKFFVKVGVYPMIILTKK